MVILSWVLLQVSLYCSYAIAILLERNLISAKLLDSGPMATILEINKQFLDKIFSEAKGVFGLDYERDFKRGSL